MIPAHCPRIFRFLDVFFRFWTGAWHLQGGGKVENCLHDTSTLSQNSFFPRFWPECSKIRCVQKPNAHRVPFWRGGPPLLFQHHPAKRCRWRLKLQEAQRTLRGCTSLMGSISEHGFPKIRQGLGWGKWGSARESLKKGSRLNWSKGSGLNEPSGSPLPIQRVTHHFAIVLEGWLPEVNGSEKPQGEVWADLKIGGP